MTCYLLTFVLVAKIDALQAEYSAFETVHETDGLIETARELGIAYVAYSPLGHGWLVDDFPYQSPDDFSANDFRRGCMCLIRFSQQSLKILINLSAKIPRRQLLS